MLEFTFNMYVTLTLKTKWNMLIAPLGATKNLRGTQYDILLIIYMYIIGENVSSFLYLYL